ncbi:copper amine oxidase N-terminal domain-containing protein [Fenollaria sporofastidiosus]|uniref:copper amine oxidase N-terminal domain-containing protein n=1 Tax=Fenollaria sporofastidiosus TaxID=2811778 RepID=UPI001BFFE785|nr:copper amine oxidase N-terminal domain-containing protein [Fenollaria sporofastidiosus]
MKWMKKALCLGLALIIMLSVAAIAKEEPVKIYINKGIIPSDQPPIIKNSRVLVPLRVIAEQLGADVSYEAKERRVNINKDEISMTLVIGDDTIWYSDKEKSGPVAIDVPAMIKNGRTMVPLRAVAELFDMNVKWDGKKRAVYIDNNTENQYTITLKNAGLKIMDALKQKGSLPDGTYVADVIREEIDFDGAKVQGYAVTLRKDNPNDKSLAELVGHYFIDESGSTILHYDVVTDTYKNIFLE